MRTDEGFLKDFVSGFKSGVKSGIQSVVNSNELTAGQKYMNSLPKQFTYNGKKFNVSWGNAEQQKYGELGDVQIAPADTANKEYYFAYCEKPTQYDDNEKWQFIIAFSGDPNVYFKYKTKGWYVDPGKNGTSDAFIQFDLNEIAKEILSHEASAQKNESRASFIVNKILEGADVRYTIGKDVDLDDCVNCSCCGKSVDTDAVEVWVDGFKLCPNCDAKLKDLLPRPVADFCRDFDRSNAENSALEEFLISVIVNG